MIVSFPRSGNYLLKAVVELSFGLTLGIEHNWPGGYDDFSQIIYLKRNKYSILNSMYKQRKWWGFSGNCSLADFFRFPVGDLLIEPDPTVRLVEIHPDGSIAILDNLVQPFDWWQNYKDVTVFEAIERFNRKWEFMENDVCVISFEQLLVNPMKVGIQLKKVLNQPQEANIKFPGCRVGRYVLGDEFQLDLSRNNEYSKISLSK